MVTGIECAGIVLAVLPLMAARITEYANGVNSMKVIFSRRRYCRELKMYCASIGVQRSILLDTVTKLLQDTVSFEDEISEMLQNPQHHQWKNPAIEQSLKTQLTGDYDNFRMNMEVVNDLLVELQKKLGMSTSKPMQSQSVLVLDEIKRIKQVFEFETCEKLCSRLENANSLLNRLVELSIQRSQQTKRPKLKAKSFEKHKRLRRRAKSVHKAMISQHRWSCQCHQPHILNFKFSLPDEQGSEQVHGAFRIHCGIPSGAQQPVGGPSWTWKNIETTTVDESESVHYPVSTVQLPAGSSSQSSRVAFATSSAGSSTTTIVASSIADAKKIHCLCSSLRDMTTTKKRHLLGYLEDEEDPDLRHETYVIQNSLKDPTVQTLAETLNCPAQTAQWLRDIPSARLPLQHRLQIAANLAYGTLQLHGSWLPEDWSPKDVVFVGEDIPETPFISWRLPQGAAHPPQSSARIKKHVLIPSQTLFPLGLVLVQLALCKTLEELRQPEDENPDEIVAALSTASRVLPAVEWECGKQYFMATQSCLRWCGQTDKGMDDDDFQRAVFDFVVRPLVDCLEIFRRDV